MNLSKVLFIGGGGGNMATVQIRCIDIAKRLGCDFMYGNGLAEQIPDWYSAFVCVKAFFYPLELQKLSKRGTIVWDIIDGFPPKENVAIYLTSTAIAENLFARYGRVELIPHHHCNFEGKPNDPTNRRPAWIGSRHWLPQLDGFEYDTYFVEGMTREGVASSFSKTGIGLNFRGEATMKERIFNQTSSKKSDSAKTLYNFHIIINSGIKLINCLGFGIPSVSCREPAYIEMGQECTIFSSFKNCAKWVHALQSDEALYLDFREKCLRKAKRFHIDAVAEKYKKLLQSL